MNKDKQHNLKEDVLYSELCGALYACKLYSDSMSLVIWNENEYFFLKTKILFINFVNLSNMPLQK
jgi:hypothetical protein